MSPMSSDVSAPVCCASARIFSKCRFSAASVSCRYLSVINMQACHLVSRLSATAAVMIVSPRTSEEQTDAHLPWHQTGGLARFAPAPEPCCIRDKRGVCLRPPAGNASSSDGRKPLAARDRCQPAPWSNTPPGMMYKEVKQHRSFPHRSHQPHESPRNISHSQKISQEIPLEC